MPFIRTPISLDLTYLQVVDVVLTLSQVFHIRIPLLQHLYLRFQAVGHLLSLRHLFQIGLIQYFLHQLLQTLHWTLQLLQSLLCVTMHFNCRPLRRERDDDGARVGEDLGFLENKTLPAYLRHLDHLLQVLQLLLSLFQSLLSLCL